MCVQALILGGIKRPNLAYMENSFVDEHDFLRILYSLID